MIREVEELAYENKDEGKIDRTMLWIKDGHPVGSIRIDVDLARKESAIRVVRRGEFPDEHVGTLIQALISALGPMYEPKTLRVRPLEDEGSNN